MAPSVIDIQREQTPPNSPSSCCQRVSKFSGSFPFSFTSQTDPSPATHTHTQNIPGRKVGLTTRRHSLVSEAAI